MIAATEPDRAGGRQATEACDQAGRCTGTLAAFDQSRSRGNAASPVPPATQQQRHGSLRHGGLRHSSLELIQLGVLLLQVIQENLRWRRGGQGQGQGRGVVSWLERTLATHTTDPLLCTPQAKGFPFQARQEPPQAPARGRGEWEGVGVGRPI